MRTLLVGALLACLSFAGCAGPKEPRLIGTWQSDKEGTLEIVTAYRDLSKVKPEHRKMMEDIFGKLIVTYDGHSVHAKLDAWEHSSDYKILGRNETCVVIESQDLLREGQKSIEIIRFEDPDRYVLLSQDLNFPEVFKRVK